MLAPKLFGHLGYLKQNSVQMYLKRNIQYFVHSPVFLITSFNILGIL